MEVSRSLFVGVACIGLAVSAVQDEVAAQSGQTKPWRWTPGLGRVLDLSRPPIVIDEPGLYAIQKHWRIPNATTQVVPELIKITADDVVLNMHNLEISADTGFDGPSSTLLVITGRRVQVRNGGLFACCDGAVAVRATSGPTFHHLTIESYQEMTFEGGGVITDSVISPNVGIRFGGGNVVIERNDIRCNRGLRCLTFLGDGNRITNNSMSMSQGGGIDLVGNRSTVANNYVDLTQDVDGHPVFDIQGDHNVVRANTVLVIDQSGSRQGIWTISGTANTLDGNIAAATAEGQRAQTGMVFTADGNFYGNNRMAAQTPFVLGGRVQTDWGGNVGY